MAGGGDYDGWPETSANQQGPSDATVDAHFGSLGAATGGPDGGAAPVICNGGCLCFGTPDACAANRCTLASHPQSDGATAFECDNGPLGFICETSRGGRCLPAGATCANPAPQYGCDTWPSTGAFCCLDPVGEGGRGCPTECSVDSDCANCGLPDGCTGRNTCVSGICVQATCPLAGDSGVDAQEAADASAPDGDGCACTPLYQRCDTPDFCGCCDPSFRCSGGGTCIPIP